MIFKPENYLASENFSLKDRDPSSLADLPQSKTEREAYLAAHGILLDELQDKFYAENRRKLLIILQGMDTSGKDGTIRHVFHAVDPLGIRAEAFKAPTAIELSHDYLWRIHKKTPKNGEIVIFNRSQYEDVLVTYVKKQIDKAEMERRLQQINDFEKMLAETGTVIIKFFLHISKDEQRKRLQKRVDNEKKHWKFNIGDLEDRRLWDDFQAQYQTVIRATHRPHAPWYIVPADSKSGRNIVVLNILLAHLRALNLQYPQVDNSAWKGITVE